MFFNSSYFLVFFTVVFLLYYSVPSRFRWVVLLVSSLVFYAFYSPLYLMVPLSISSITFLGGAAVSRSKGTVRRNYLVLTTGICLLTLFVFKYFNFFESNIGFLGNLFGADIRFPAINLIIPLGISFYIFQSLSYVFEIFRKNIKTEKSFFRYCLFVLFFPLVLSGPIERANRLLPQLRFYHRFEYGQVSFGLRLIAWGLFKKVVVADRLGVLVDQIYKLPQDYRGIPLILATFFFAYQLYLDFSGYSDMARGIARVLGIKVINNFNFPYASRSVSDFWRRWHISLSTYLNDYLYTPLALSWRSKGLVGIMGALIITFTLIGFWHGASWTYGIFGFLEAFAMSFEILTKKLRKKIFANFPSAIYSALALIATFTFWLFSCIFFRANNISDSFYIITHLFSPMPISEITQKGLGLLGFDIALGILGIAFVEAIQFFQRNGNLNAMFFKKPVLFRLTAYYLLVLAILFFGKFGPNQFIYFKF